MAAVEDETIVIGPSGERRLKGVTLAVPVVAGTIAFFLGKKATDNASHRWTAYLRSYTGEDLTHIFSKVTIVLHSSFTNPERDIAYPPYEVTEVGWGEFDIVVRLHFKDDAMEPPVEVYHRLKLYDESGVNNAKKPVVAESYDEIVMWEPTEAFYNRVMSHEPRPAPNSQIAQFYTQFNLDYEYRRVQHARQRVAQITANVRAQLAAVDADDS